uniref:LO1-3 n=1 Tax=Swordtail adomavirus 2 TaxID=2609877 RepID=A0A6F9F0J1_9VIRU|nr:TPA_asm: LO1-3 [Swordtail adomavirus 2]
MLICYKIHVFILLLLCFVRAQEHLHKMQTRSKRRPAQSKTRPRKNKPKAIVPVTKTRKKPTKAPDPIQTPAGKTEVVLQVALPIRVEPAKQKGKPQKKKKIKKTNLKKKPPNIRKLIPTSKGVKKVKPSGKKRPRVRKPSLFTTKTVKTLDDIRRQLRNTPRTYYRPVIHNVNNNTLSASDRVPGLPSPPPAVPVPATAPSFFSQTARKVLIPLAAPVAALALGPVAGAVTSAISQYATGNPTPSPDEGPSPAPESSLLGNAYTALSSVASILPSVVTGLSGVYKALRGGRSKLSYRKGHVVFLGSRRQLHRVHKGREAPKPKAHKSIPLLRRETPSDFHKLAKLIEEASSRKQNTDPDEDFRTPPSTPSWFVPKRPLSPTSTPLPLTPPSKRRAWIPPVTDAIPEYAPYPPSQAGMPPAPPPPPPPPPLMLTPQTDFKRTKIIDPAVHKKALEKMLDSPPVITLDQLRNARLRPSSNRVLRDPLPQPETLHTSLMKAIHNSGTMWGRTPL